MSTAGMRMTFLGSDRDPTSRRGSAAGARASACASHRSPRWCAAPLDLAGTGRAGALPGLGPVARSAERHGKAAGGLRVGAPARSEQIAPPAGLQIFGSTECFENSKGENS